MLDRNVFAEYAKLNDKFVAECERVIKVLERDDVDWVFMREFRLDFDNNVYCWGDDSWGYGGYEEYDKSFPSEYLMMSDDELNKIVDEKIAERKKLNEKREEEERKRKLREYNRLKKELGL